MVAGVATARRPCRSNQPPWRPQPKRSGRRRRCSSCRSVVHRLRSGGVQSSGWPVSRLAGGGHAEKVGSASGRCGDHSGCVMAIDTWRVTRSGVARLLGRGEPARQAGFVASARDWRMAVGQVMRGLGQSVPGWRVCMGLLLALVPRLVGLTADLPYMHHPDEPVNLRVIDAMVVNGALTRTSSTTRRCSFTCTLRFTSTGRCWAGCPGSPSWHRSPL